MFKCCSVAVCLFNNISGCIVCDGLILIIKMNIVRGDVAQWFVPLVMWRSCVRAPSKAPVVSLSKKLCPYCLVLVGSRNGFELDFTIELE